jgi:predicted ABC-type ATPase
VPSSARPTIYLIAGCNGAGKTTFAKEFLPHEVHCLRFFNADEIARGLSPLDPRASATKAARLLLEELHGAIRQRKTFGLESTLSGLTYIRLLQKAKQERYVVKVFFLWLPSITIAIRRVRERVRKGGHHVPAVDVRRRFNRGLRNLVVHYLAPADEWTIFDNSGLEPRLVARGTPEGVDVLDTRTYAEVTLQRR